MRRSRAFAVSRPRAFATLPEEVRLRLLLRAIDALGHEGPAELGKVETLLAALDQAMRDQGHARPLPCARKGPCHPEADPGGSLDQLCRGAYPHRACTGPAVPRKREKVT